MPDAVEQWKKQGATVYLVVTTVAGWVVIVSMVTERRPSETVATVAGSIGLAPVQRWLTVDAPAAITASSAPFRDALLWTVVLVAVVIAGRVLFLGCRHRDGIKIEAGVVMSSRAAATPWLLVLLAAQQGPFRVSSVGLVHVLVRAGTVVLIGFASWLVLWALLRWLGLHLVGDLLAALARAIWRVVSALLVLPLGMLWSLVAPLLAVGGWLFQPEPDRLRDARREHAAHEDIPTGAIRTMTPRAPFPS
ncbi:MAG: hypothetical protein QM677_06660 [Microbacterium sp.]